MNRRLAVAFLAAAMLGASTTQANDLARGEAIYQRCAACHALAYDRTGPHHCGLFGRHAGSVPGFNYSPAMKAARITWNKQTLDRFLAGPTKVVPGTTMTYAGIADPAERKELIAWLRVATADPQRCPASTKLHAIKH